MAAAPQAVAQPEVMEEFVEPTTTIAGVPEQPEEPPPAFTPLSVVHEVTPEVPQSVRAKIQGRIYVTVRVLVDPAGAVIGVLMENAGSSPYFARVSEEAARQWEFAPADTDKARVWLLRFEYNREGVVTRVIEQ